MTILVFDFDGVIIDSKKMYVELIKKALEEKRVKILIGEIDEKLIPSIKGTIEKVLPDKIENRERVINKTEKRVIELTSAKGLNYVELSKHAINTLEALKKNNKIFLLSNSHSGFINKVLNKFNLNHFFDDIITLDSVFSSKDKALRHISKIENIKISDIFYIGDTREDIKLARNVGCKIIIVFNSISWDFPNIQKILELKPDYLIDKLSSLILLEKFF